MLKSDIPAVLPGSVFVSCLSSARHMLRDKLLMAVLAASTLLITSAEVIARDSIDQYTRPYGPVIST